MSIIVETAPGGGEQFAFTTTFANTGSRWSKVQINTFTFYTEGDVSSWVIALVDDAGDVVTNIFASSTATFYTTGIGPIPVADDGTSYQLRFTTDTMTQPGKITIDWQVAKTGAT